MSVYEEAAARLYKDNAFFLIFYVTFYYYYYYNVYTHTTNKVCF